MLLMRGELWLSSVWQGWLMEDLKRRKNKAPSLHGSSQKGERFISLFYWITCSTWGCIFCAETFEIWSSFVEHNCLKLYYGDFYAVILCYWKSSPLFPKVVAFSCENTWKCWWHHKKTSQNLFNPPKSEDILILWHPNCCSSVKWFEPYLI